MSSKTRKLVKSVERKESSEKLALYTTLIGTIITSVGIICGKDEEANLKLFRELDKNKKVLPTTVAELVEYVWTIHGNDDFKQGREALVLLFDDNNLYSPMVTLFNGEQLFPLRRDGMSYGILGLLRKAMVVANDDNAPEDDKKFWAEKTAAFGIEYLYDEDGEPLGDDE